MKGALHIRKLGSGGKWDEVAEFGLGICQISVVLIKLIVVIITTLKR